MGQLRRKVYNYTIVALNKEGTAPDVHVCSFAALRIRDGKEVAFYHCPHLPVQDRKERGRLVGELRDFIGDDLVLTGVVNDMIPTMEKLYQENCGAFFTNVSLDLFPVEEEVDGLLPDASAFKQQVLQSHDDTDALHKARVMYDIYEEAATFLYGYQTGFPYWVCSLPYEEERYMAKQLPNKQKRFKKALLAWFVGCHYFYFGRKWMNVLYLFTFGGCLIWALIELYRLPVMVDDANEKIALDTYQRGPKIGQSDSMTWSVPE